MYALLCREDWEEGRFVVAAVVAVARAFRTLNHSESERESQ